MDRNRHLDGRDVAWATENALHIIIPVHVRDYASYLFCAFGCGYIPAETLGLVMKFEE